jgi:hypothetical protein
MYWSLRPVLALSTHPSNNECRVEHDKETVWTLPVATMIATARDKETIRSGQRLREK